jgi:hypothetical protein
VLFVGDAGYFTEPSTEMYQEQFFYSLILFIPSIVNYLQTLTLATNAQLYVHLCISLLISSYTFRLNCRHQGANPYATKTYSNKTVLKGLRISDVQIISFTSQHQNPYVSGLCQYCPFNSIGDNTDVLQTNHM